MKKTLKEWRLEKGYRTGWVAEKIGMDKAQFCNKENGRRHFNVQETQQLIEIYNVDFSDVQII